MARLDGQAGSTSGEKGGWVRAWRPPDLAGVVAMHGSGMSYRCAPHGEYLIAHLSAGGVEIGRGRERYVMQPGDLGVWEPRGVHGGASTNGGVFEARLLVIELPSFADVVADPEGCAVDLEFGSPVLRDPGLASSFLRLHGAFTDPASGLEREAMLADWVQQVAALDPVGATRRRERGRSARRDPALTRACELLDEEVTSDLDLAALAAAAGTSKYRLIRLFKTGLGLPPHAYQIQLRVQRSRTLLEAGHPPDHVPHLGGSHDQSHLNTAHRAHSRPLCPSIPRSRSDAMTGVCDGRALIHWFPETAVSYTSTTYKPGGRASG